MLVRVSNWRHRRCPRPIRSRETNSVGSRNIKIFVRTRIPPELVVRLVKFCKMEVLALLLGYDASNHHKIWESSDINRIDEYLLQFIFSNNLEIHNVYNIWTGIRQEILYTTLGKTLMSSLVKNWGCWMSPQCRITE